MNIARCFTISPQLSFLDALAQEVLLGAGENPLTLAQHTIFLPTQRACRALREAFLRNSSGKPLLLPRIIPLGEVANEADFSLLSMHDSLESIPAIMPALRREFMLAKMVAQFNGARPHVAYSLAKELCVLLDEATQHGVSLNELRSIVPQQLASHWQHSLEFLNIISLHWPRILAQENTQDASHYQQQMLAALCESWQAAPPDFPIIAAGSTGSVPAVALLLKTIATLPRGRVILPALDTQMSEEAWEMIAPTHPQYALKQWLSFAEIPRKNVGVLPYMQPHNHTISAIFAPAELTAAWHNQPADIAKDTGHIQLLEAPTQHAEARMVAVLLREALETPEKTAALITPDRTLARMVAAQCNRFGVTVDDSAGSPLSATPAAAFLKLIIDMVDEECAPHSLLACLRHPFAASGVSTAQCRFYSRQLELKCLRGIRLNAGMEALIQAAKNAGCDAPMIGWLEQIEQAIKPLVMMRLRGTALAFSEQLRAHIQAAEALATTDVQNGAEILWAKDSGNQLAQCMENWLAEAEHLLAVLPSDYAALFETMLAGEAFRPRYGSHPRLHILSPMEARMLHFDRVILGELSEGVWPMKGRADPWMSAPMRTQLGLPPEERHVGQSAHDVEMLLYAPEVFLTRAHKIAGKPTVASRWWVRLSTFIQAKNATQFLAMNRSQIYSQYVASLDAPAPIAPLARPAPLPPVALRPHSFSATEIDTLRTEPYAIYAKKMLGLKALDELDAEPDQAHFGNVIHKALELFSKQHPSTLPEQALQLLLNCGTEAFATLWDKPAVKTLWWPRFEAIAALWLQREAALRNEVFTSHAEVLCEWNFKVNGLEYRLRARADRVDVFAGGHCRIIDYKTGQKITTKQITELQATQLPLTALALLRGNTKNEIIIEQVESLNYWFVKAGADEWVGVNATNGLLEQTHHLLNETLAHYQNPNHAYLPQSNPKLFLKYNDYEALIRWQEWGQG